MGRGVGLRLLETLCHRERSGKRDTRLLDVLKFVHTTLWKYLFGRQARDLEQSNAVRRPLPDPLCMTCPDRASSKMLPGAPQVDDEYMISDCDLFVTKYVSVPKDLGTFTPAAFVAGVVKGVLDGAGFPARWGCLGLLLMQRRR